MHFRTLSRLVFRNWELFKFIFTWKRVCKQFLWILRKLMNYFKELQGLKKSRFTFILKPTLVPSFSGFNPAVCAARCAAEVDQHRSLHWPSEIQCSLHHWSTILVLSQCSSWPLHTPIHTLSHTSVVRRRAGKWGQRWLVVIHLCSMTAAANKSLIHCLIHRLSPADALKTTLSQNTLPALRSHTPPQRATHPHGFTWCYANYCQTCWHKRLPLQRSLLNTYNKVSFQKCRVVGQSLDNSSLIPLYLGIKTQCQTGAGTVTNTQNYRLP